MVSRKAKEIYNEFKKKQAEYWNLWMAAIPIIEGTEDEPGLKGDDVVHIEGHANGNFEAVSFDLMSTLPQHHSHNDQVGNTPVDAVFNDMLDNRGFTSNISSDHGETSEATPFVATNPLSCLDHYKLLQSSTEDVPGLLPSQELPESHILNHEARQSTLAPVPLSNNTPASGLYASNSNQVAEALFRQVVNTSQQEKLWLQQQVNILQQEKQELRKEKEDLKRKNWELQIQLSEKQTELSEFQRNLVTNQMLVCSEENRPPKRR